jgi:lipopolysaccharide/colanic/teichoic acid biosynthesis glycosyltransferase
MVQSITLIEPDKERSVSIAKLIQVRGLHFSSFQGFDDLVLNYNWAIESPVFLIAESIADPVGMRNFMNIAQSKIKNFPIVIILSQEFQIEKKRLFENQGLVGVLLYDTFSNGIAVDLLNRMVEKWLQKPLGKVVIAENIFYKSPRYDIPFGKRFFDVVSSGMALLLLLPVFAVIAILIKKDSKGPVFYISKRVGQGFQIFDLYKFRTMVPDADKKLKEISHLNQYASAKNNTTKAEVGELCAMCASEGIPCAFPLYTDSGVVCEKLFMAQKSDNADSFNKFTNDPRVTKLGNFLRNTSIDELPQLFNVLKGDMSIVGNRPLPLYEAEKLTTNDISQRFLAPAGITGLWQVKKRGRSTEMSPEERMQLDNDYAKHYNMWFDLKIILMTIPALFQKENV